MPENLLKASKEYTQEAGYRNVQEFIVDLVRSKVMLERVQQYKKIEEEMKQGKKVKKFNQKDAVQYVKKL